MSVDLILNDRDRTVSRFCDNRQVGLFLASTWARYFSQFVPMRTKTLRDSFSIEPFRITYNAPYAHYQWEGKLYVSPTTGSSYALPGEIKQRTEIDLTYNGELNRNATDHWHLAAESAFAGTVARQVSRYIGGM